MPRRLGSARVPFRLTIATPPESFARRFLAAILAANKNATVTQIQTSTDVAIQTNVDAVVDVFAGI